MNGSASTGGVASRCRDDHGRIQASGVIGGSNMRTRRHRASVALALLVATPPSLAVSGLLPGPSVTPYAAGVVAIAYLDENADGRHDAADETVLPGWEMRLVSPEVPDHTEQSAAGTPRVRWWLGGSSATVAAVAPPGYELTTPAVRTVSLEAGRIRIVRFGARATPELTSHIEG
jgi:hypothetical protein